MSRIVELRVHDLRVPLRRPFATAVRRTEALEALLVEIVDNDGRSGWGEAALSWRVTGESRESARVAALGPIRESLMGLPIDDAEGWDRALTASVAGNAAIRSAVDVALWDLLAQAAGLPLYRLLDAAAPGTVRTDATIAIGSIDRVLADAEQLVADGYGTIKVKVGSDPQTDDAVVRALRAGPARAQVLRLDANQGWDAPTAIRLLRGWEEAGIGLELVEQPTPAGDLAALAAVTAAVETPVLADESVRDLRQLLEIARAGAAQLVNIKLAKCGGLSAARRMVAAADDAGVGVIIGSMLESTIGVSAAAHLAASRGDVVHDLDAAVWLGDAPRLHGGASAEGELLRLGEAPGLGARLRGAAA